MVMVDEREIVWDFGFSDGQDLSEVHQANREMQGAKATAEELQTRLDDLYKAFQPLLGNLKREPQKDYILFPDRIPKLEAFEAQLAKIYYGK